jgi:hypothetical protein
MESAQSGRTVQSLLHHKKGENKKKDITFSLNKGGVWKDPESCAQIILSPVVDPETKVKIQHSPT